MEARSTILKPRPRAHRTRIRSDTSDYRGSYNQTVDLSQMNPNCRL